MFDYSIKKDVDNIRYLRIKKYKRQFNTYKVVAQVVAIWYIIIFTSSYLTSYTTAYFNDNDHVSSSIKAGTWDTDSEDQSDNDKSSLTFTNDKDIVLQSCTPVEISAEIKNTGNQDMKGTTEFDVYYHLDGNPKKGEKIDSGIIEPLKQNQSTYLNYLAEEVGHYKFKAYQRPNHANKPDERQDLWSGTIILSCEDQENEHNKNTDKGNNSKNKTNGKTETIEENETQVLEEKNTQDEIPLKEEQPLHKEEESQDDRNISNGIVEPHVEPLKQEETEIIVETEQE